MIRRLIAGLITSLGFGIGGAVVGVGKALIAIFRNPGSSSDADITMFLIMVPVAYGTFTAIIGFLLGFAVGMVPVHRGAPLALVPKPPQWVRLTLEPGSRHAPQQGRPSA